MSAAGDRFWWPSVTRQIRSPTSWGQFLRWPGRSVGFSWCLARYRHCLAWTAVVLPNGRPSPWVVQESSRQTSRFWSGGRPATVSRHCTTPCPSTQSRLVSGIPTAHCLALLGSEMTYTVSSGTVNSSIPYHCLALSSASSDSHRSSWC